MVYPISNRPNSLQIDYFYLQRQVGQYLKYGFSSAEWDDEQVLAVDEILDEGCRLYYFPPVLREPFATGTLHVHEWSFMRPTFRLKTVAAQRRYPLPPTWERPIGNMSNQDANATFYLPIMFSSASRLRHLDNLENFTSYPRIAAVEPGESTGEAAQQLILVLHPTPDAEYNLEVQYQAHARKLSPQQPFPLGGQPHGPGILAAVMAVAELRATGQEGTYHSQFMSKLAANVARDHQRGAKNLGYNANGAIGKRWGRGSLRDCNGLFYDETSYDGNYYSGE